MPSYYKDNTMASPTFTSKKMIKPSLCRPRRNCQRQWTTFSLPILAFALASSAIVASSSQTFYHHLLRGQSSSSTPRLLRQHERRRTVEEEEGGSKKSNDDEHTTIALHPFSLQLSNLPPTSPMLLAITNTDGSTDGLSTAPTIRMDRLLEYITYLGTLAFNESQVYGERFDEWDVGNVWSVGGSSDFVLPSAASAAAPSSLAETEMSRSDNTNVQQPTMVSDDTGDGDDDMFDRLRQRKLAADPSTAILLTLGHNGTVTFNGTYWEDSPNSRELNEFLVKALNSDANRKKLLVKLGPLVCTAEDLIGRECDVMVEVVTIGDAAPAIVGEEEDDTQDVTTTEDEVQEEVGDDAQNVTTVEENEVLVDNEPFVDDANSSEQATSTNPNSDATSPNTPGDETNGEAQDMTTTENEVQDLLGGDAQDVTTTVEENEVLVEPAPLDDANSSEQATANPNGDATIPNSTPGDETNDSEVIPVLGTSDQVEVTDLATDSVGTTTNSLEASSPSDSQYTPSSLASAQDTDQGGNSDNNLLQIIIPIAIGAALVAFLIVGLVYRRRRKQRKAKKDDGLLDKTTDEETPPELMPPTSWSNNAYDDITSTPKRPGDSSTAATAGASVTATATATAAGAPTTKKARNIENILEDFSDGDSSFISDSSAATSNVGGGGANTGSILSGLTGILGGGSSPTPLDDVARNTSSSRLSANSATKQSDGDTVPPLIMVNSKDRGDGPSMRKQEDFEGSYRTRSAMAKLNLKKDILHVECETHDAPTAESGGDTNAGGAYNDGYNNIGNNQASGKGYGVTRTISPKKSTDMMEKQRIAEKLSRRSATSRFKGRKENKVPTTSLNNNNNEKQKEQKKKEEEEHRESSKDLILPKGFKRSDSVVSRSSGDESIMSEDDYSSLV